MVHTFRIIRDGVRGYKFLVQEHGNCNEGITINGRIYKPELHSNFHPVNNQVLECQLYESGIHNLFENLSQNHFLEFTTDHRYIVQTASLIYSLGNARYKSSILIPEVRKLNIGDFINWLNVSYR